MGNGSGNEMARETALRLLTENGKLVLAIMKNQKNGSNSPKMHPRAKLPITDPQKFGSAVLQVLTEMENWCRPL